MTPAPATAPATALATAPAASTLAHLARLVGFETLSRRSNLGIIDYIEDCLAGYGFRTRRIPAPLGDRVGLFAEIGPAGRGILVSGHTDVVPVEGQTWTRPPFSLTQEGDRFYGRGTTDMKGYLATMLWAAERAAAAPLRHPLKLVFSYDEEVGCIGISQMMPTLAPLLGQPQICIVGEPTEMQVAIGHKGKVALTATCFGQSGHSALAPRFVNALHLASDFVTGLRELQTSLETSGPHDPAYDIPYSTVHAGILHGGTALNIVPDRAEITFEIRHLAADMPDRLIARISDMAETVARPYRAHHDAARIEVSVTNTYPGLATDPSDPAVVQAMALAQSNTVTKVPFGTEAGFFAGLGHPTIVCGPGSMEGQGHKPDEFITADQIAASEAMMARIIESLCTG